MRTTVTLSDDLFSDIMKQTRAKSISQAIRTALEGYLLQKKRERLIASFGNFPKWKPPLKKMRQNRDIGRL